MSEQSTEADEIARLQKLATMYCEEAMEASTANGRHFALLIQQRIKTRSIALAADVWLKQRDEAREAARQLLGRTATFQEENEAIALWPWLEYHA
jgi:hypothetical protein